MERQVLTGFVVRFSYLVAKNVQVDRLIQSECRLVKIDILLVNNTLVFAIWTLNKNDIKMAIISKYGQNITMPNVWNRNYTEIRTIDCLVIRHSDFGHIRARLNASLDHYIYSERLNTECLNTELCWTRNYRGFRFQTQIIVRLPNSDH